MSTVQADPIFDSFGLLPQATFGGTDIPNDAVAASTQFVDSGVVITLGLTATPRFSAAPAVTNDGQGRFFAEAGNGPVGSDNESTAQWNFGFYIEVDDPTGGKSLDDYDITLFYDFDPGQDTPTTVMGRFLIDEGAALDPSEPTVSQGSQNLTFGFLENGFTPPITGAPQTVVPPTGSITTFDVDAFGEYSFAISVARPGDLFPLESVQIEVQTIPEPTGAAVLALGGLGLMTRRLRCDQR
ncbi:MAG: hypothetical protein AAF710_06865 [Planctomycetota bacterium]